MRRPTFLSEAQADRLRDVLDAIDDGLKQGEAARSMRCDPANLSYFLRTLIGTSAWPPQRTTIEKLLLLPILEDREARVERGHQAWLTTQASEMEDRIRQREANNQRRREEHERHWLSVEQTKYGLGRMGRPLSRMPA